jgi:hypothetical protein
VLENEGLTKNATQELCQRTASSRKKIYFYSQKKSCAVRVVCYSLPMQANSLITDDFNTQIQSDEFASEFEAWLDEQEKNYWREIDARGN